MIYRATVPPFIKTLHSLLAILDKGAALADVKKFPVENLLQARLALDQFPLTKQIQIACDTAKLSAARLTGREAPTHPDTETTLGELRTRIRDVIGFLETFSSAQYTESANKHISLPRWEGKYMTGEEYAFDYAIPNFYFHITTAYSILRHNGVEVGKGDYLGKLAFKNG